MKKITTVLGLTLALATLGILNTYADLTSETEIVLMPLEA